MPIVYTKLFDLLKEKGYTTYKIRQEKLIGQGTLTAIKNGTGGLDAKTIARLCEVLECQPGDLMEYVSEEKQENKKWRDSLSRLSLLKLYELNTLCTTSPQNWHR